MKAKLTYSGLVGVTTLDAGSLDGKVAISGSESLVQQADDLYRSGNEGDARNAVREALRIALQRLDAGDGLRRKDGKPGSVVSGAA